VGKRVLLIDVDMRRPSQHRYFGLSRTEKGLSTVLAGLNIAQDVIIGSQFENLSMMPAGPLPPDPATLLGSNSLQPILAELLADYDLIILDGPPVMALADAVELTSVAEGTVFVVEAGESQIGQSRSSIGRLIRASGHLVGAIVTKYNSSDSRYSYYSGYYNYHYETQKS
jgi:capsular exopolysaccharide synthesis family protein